MIITNTKLIKLIDDFLLTKDSTVFISTFKNRFPSNTYEQLMKNAEKQENYLDKKTHNNWNLLTFRLRDKKGQDYLIKMVCPTNNTPPRIFSMELDGRNKLEK